MKLRSKLTLRNASLRFRTPASVSFSSNNAGSAGDTRHTTISVLLPRSICICRMDCAQR